MKKFWKSGHPKRTLKAQQLKGNRRRRGRRSLKGIVGYQGRRPSMMNMEHPLQFHGKKMSYRPNHSTKRLGRRRGPGNGGKRKEGRRWPGGA